MPVVKGKHFNYTTEGMAKAKAYGKRTGMPMQMGKGMMARGKMPMKPTAMKPMMGAAKRPAWRPGGRPGAAKRR